MEKTLNLDDLEEKAPTVEVQNRWLVLPFTFLLPQTNKQVESALNHVFPKLAQPGEPLLAMRLIQLSPETQQWHPPSHLILPIYSASWHKAWSETWFFFTRLFLFNIFLHQVKPQEDTTWLIAQEALKDQQVGIMLIWVSCTIHLAILLLRTHTQSILTRQEKAKREQEEKEKERIRLKNIEKVLVFSFSLSLSLYPKKLFFWIWILVDEGAGGCGTQKTRGRGLNIFQMNMKRVRVQIDRVGLLEW